MGHRSSSSAARQACSGAAQGQQKGVAIGQSPRDLRRGREKQRRLLVDEYGAPPFGGRRDGGRCGESVRREGGKGRVRRWGDAIERGGRSGRSEERPEGGRRVGRIAALGTRGGHLGYPGRVLFGWRGADQQLCLRAGWHMTWRAAVPQLQTKTREQKLRQRAVAAAARGQCTERERERERGGAHQGSHQ